MYGIFFTWIYSGQPCNSVALLNAFFHHVVVQIIGNPWFMRILKCNDMLDTLG